MKYCYILWWYYKPSLAECRLWLKIFSRKWNLQLFRRVLEYCGKVDRPRCFRSSTSSFMWPANNEYSLINNNREQIRKIIKTHRKNWFVFNRQSEVFSLYRRSFSKRKKNQLKPPPGTLQFRHPYSLLLRHRSNFSSSAFKVIFIFIKRKMRFWTTRRSD